MDLKIEEVADLLQVSEVTVKRWLADGKIPAYRIDQQYRFSRIEIEDWVIQQRQTKSTDTTGPVDEAWDSSIEEKQASSHVGNKQFSLYRALNKGCVIAGIAGDTKEQVIRLAMKQIANELLLDAEGLTELLLDRERLQPTALNNGIGIPHTRDFLLNATHDVVSIVFPEKPLEYGALDNQPVHTLFFLFAADDKRHLHLLAKIAHFSSNPDCLKFLATQPNKPSLLQYIKEWESNLRG